MRLIPFLALCLLLAGCSSNFAEVYDTKLAQLHLLALEHHRVGSAVNINNDNQVTKAAIDNYLAWAANHREEVQALRDFFVEYQEEIAENGDDPARIQSVADTFLAEMDDNKKNFVAYNKIYERYN